MSVAPLDTRAGSVYSPVPKHMRPSVYLLPALACAGCDYTVLMTEVGEHVVYHWDPGEKQIYGGTIATADRFLELIPAYYGLPLVSAGPNIEYFWGRGWRPSGICMKHAGACTWWQLSGFAVFANDPVHTHEFAHTAAGGHGKPPFLAEGFAVRWQSTVIDSGPAGSTERFYSASEAELRAELRVKDGMQVDRDWGFAWWLALEAHFGPEKVGEFIAALGKSSSANEVEATLQAILGISLGESAVLVAAVPPMSNVVDPACALEGLPTAVWDAELLVIDRGEAHTSDDDISNTGFRDAATWLFAVEFPALGVPADIRLTMPPDMGFDPHETFLTTGPCTASILAGSQHSTARFLATHPSEGSSDGADSIRLPIEGSPGNGPSHWAGRWVGGLVATPRADGSITFPKVVFKERQP